MLLLNPLFLIIFIFKLLSDELKLLKIQIGLDKNYKLSLTGKSLYETIGHLIKLNILEEAEKIRKEFKIPDTSETLVEFK